jgi:hypothetical protein
MNNPGDLSGLPELLVCIPGECGKLSRQAFSSIDWRTMSWEN